MELVLNTFGTSLQVEDGLFAVIHKDGKQTLEAQKVKSILISKGARISSDAALLAIANEIDVLFVDRSGKPAGRVWSIKYGSVSTIRRKQLDFIYSPHAVKWIKEIIVKKIDNQIGLLLSMQPAEMRLTNIIERTINKLNDYKTKIAMADAPFLSDIAPTLRGWEGASTRAYFAVLSDLLPDNYRFEMRSQHPAKDTFNCLLNYGYGMLYGKVEGALIKAGIDPYAGVFHRDDYNRPALVYDVIELYRIWIDYVVYNLCTQRVIDEDCYSVNEMGEFWLESMGKRILIQSVNDYLDEVVNIKGVQRSRQVHIDLQAQQLAQKFLNS
ncbi:MAG TPA: CRISPR-associated endonuclease Cas1 [Bacteroidales bacterium]|nr:CRISPR-associated endonuclease Cas1 [Bacteroidales bacterium]